jgi:hypothetical protein
MVSDVVNAVLCMQVKAHAMWHRTAQVLAFNREINALLCLSFQLIHGLNAKGGYQEYDRSMVWQDV